MPKSYNLGRVKGDTGFAPIATLTKEDGILTISIEDEEGVKSESIETGEQIKPNWNAPSDSPAGILNKPDLGKVATTNSYADLDNKPTKLSAFTNDVGYITNEAIPSTLAELTGDTTHRVVTDVEKAAWNAKAEIEDIPTTAEEIGALPNTTTHLSGDVPTSRTINSKALSANIELDASDVGAIATSLLGVANGVPQLDAAGKISENNLPSYVDDVLEYDTKSSFPGAGESGKIYVDKGTNLTYRWSGTRYVEISPSIALGETSSTAYAGDKGKAVTDNLATHVANTTMHITEAERTAWNGKQNTLTAGSNITITGNTISATNTTYSAITDAEINALFV